MEIVHSTHLLCCYSGIEYEALFQQYAPKVRALAERRLRGHGLAEDVVQETLWRAYRALPELDPGRPVWPWLKTVAENVCRDVLRARQARPEHLVADPVEQGFGLSALSGMANGEVDLADEVMARERIRCIVDALDTVNPRQRQVLLHMAEGTSAEEVAAAQGVTVNAIKSAVKRGRQQFRLAYVHLASERGLLGVTVAPVDSLRAWVERARRLAAWLDELGNGSAALQVLPAALGAMAVAITAMFGGGGPIGGALLGSPSPPPRTTAAEISSAVGAAAGHVGAPVAVAVGAGVGGVRTGASIGVRLGNARRDDEYDWGKTTLKDGVAVTDAYIDFTIGINHNKPRDPMGFDLYVTGPIEDHTFEHTEMTCNAGPVSGAICNTIDQVMPQPIKKVIPIPQELQHRFPLPVG